jgi:hypothetical protein
MLEIRLFTVASPMNNMSAISRFVAPVLPIWLIVGILGDLAMVVLKPSSGEVWRFRLFGAVVPVLMWSVYYAFFILTGIGGGIWFTGYVWTGSIVEAAMVGYILAFLMSPATIAQADSALVGQER